MTCRKNLQFLIYESRQLLCSMVIGLIECRNRICGATHLVTRFEKRNVREGYLWNLRTLLTDLPPSLRRISGSNLLMSLKKSRSGRGHTSAYTVRLRWPSGGGWGDPPCSENGRLSGIRSSQVQHLLSADLLALKAQP